MQHILNSKTFMRIRDAGYTMEECIEDINKYKEVGLGYVEGYERGRIPREGLVEAYQKWLDAQ